MTTEPDQTAKPEVDDAVEVERPPVVDDLGDINSIDDVRDVVVDGIDRLKEAGTEPFKEAAKQLVNRGLAGWRKLLDGVEGKD